MIINEHNVEEYLKIMCAYFDMEPEVLFTASQRHDLCKAKHIIRTFLRKNSTLSTTLIGHLTGASDHTGVLHSSKAVQKYPEADEIMDCLKELLESFTDMMGIPQYHVTHSRLTINTGSRLVEVNYCDNQNQFGFFNMMMT